MNGEDLERLILSLDRSSNEEVCFPKYRLGGLNPEKNHIQFDVVIDERIYGEIRKLFDSINYYILNWCQFVQSFEYCEVEINNLP